MKKTFILLVTVFFAQIALAQSPVKNSYELKGDVIEATLYFEDGSVAQKGFYTPQGVITGEWTSYDRSGNKMAVAKYDNGAKTGKWFFWSDDTLREVDYSDSKIVAVNTWVNDGTRVVSNR